MSDYKFYLEKICSAVEELEELKEANKLLVQENMRLRNQLKKMGQIDYPNPKLLNEAELMGIFDIKNVHIMDRELLPIGTVQTGHYIRRDYLNQIFRGKEGRLNCSGFADLIINKKMYDIAKFFKGYWNGNERLIAFCIVLCEHYYGIQFELPDKDELVWGSRTAYKLRWFPEVLEYVKIYREKLIFNE